MKYLNFIHVFAIAFSRLFFWIVKKRSRQDIFLSLGAYFITVGTVYRVGQPIKMEKNKGGFRTVYLKNIFYDFAKNKITPSYSNKPVKGYTNSSKKS